MIEAIAELCYIYFSFRNSDDDESPALSQKDSLTPSSQVESHHSMNEGTEII